MPARMLHRRLTATELVREPENGLELRALLRAADSDADVSVTWVRIDGEHQRLRTDASTRLYIVLEGAGSITIWDEVVEVESGDLVVVPKGAPYHLAGAMTYLVLNQPGFRDGDDLYLDHHGEVVGTAPAPRPSPPAPKD